ncbi:MAG: hypothetical protein CVT67_02875 [Actinobacteria bacterium HGW-Actinobacteria-7]|jgi:excisionase family DNA binding protein|nr:MAG: hypothetical protein CVT67_02875 [Actinobacteria bacterium HGW-Actinobacteria-7]
MLELNMNTPAPKLATAEEAAEAMGVPVTQVRNLVRQGKMPHYRLGHYIRIDIEEALSWLRQEPHTSVEVAPKIIHHNARRKG